MASHIPNFFKASSHEAQQVRRNRLRRVLLETLERRELLAADLVAWESGLPNQTSSQAAAINDLVFTSIEQERQFAAYDVTTFLDRTMGGSAGTAINERPWFHLIEESYEQWSRQHGLAYSFAAGLTAEGEGDGLVAEGEAGGPRLLSVAPNSGANFSFNDVNLLTEAPTELVFRFDGSSALAPSSFNGIRVIQAGGDGSFGDGNDSVIVPGFVGFGENTRIVVLRFASTLQDDLYRVELNGNPADTNVIRNTAGLALQTRLFDSTPNDMTKDTVDFNLELGAQVVAVVPQPIDRLPSGALSPQLDTVRVYFNNDPLDPATAENPAYYQLVLTQDTVEPSDDVLRTPNTATYNAAENMVELKFTSGQLAAGGTFRLRVGSRESAVPTAPLTLQQLPEVAGNIQNSLNLPNASTSGSFSTILSQSIVTTDANLLPLDFPGSNFEPGHRDIQDESHVDGGDESPQISTVAYNFALNRPYGLDAAGRPLNTSITPEQIERVREVFDFFSETMGIDFIESESSGLTVVVGDTFPNGVVSGPGGVIGVAGNGLAIMDGAESWNNSFAADFFETAMHEIGHLLGLGHTYDLPFQTIMGSEGDLINPNNGLGQREWVYPGDHDIVHGQRLFRPDNRDVDTYRFVLNEPGRLKAETIAENLPSSSNLDTHLTLLRGVFNGGTLTGYEVIASNDNSIGSDSFLEIDLAAGTYFVSVTAKGNEDFNPLIPNSGSGGVSEGAYQLRVDFESSLPSSGTAPLTILDTAGTPLDGDGDGLAGGDFNFWFRTTGATNKTVFVDKSYNGPIFDGSAARPFNNLDFNNTLATRPAAQRWPAGHLQPGDIVRVVGSIGKPGDNPNTTTDNRAYEIGRGGVGNAILSDGPTLEVPRGVTLMVDAGAIFKMQGSRISAGSLSAGIDNSFSSVQVLGTPELPVYFTSYRDQTLGNDTNPLVTTPNSGDWGGIDFHNDVDREEGRPGFERQGIFLNYVSHADIRFGGGQITVSSPSPTVNPINMSAARPTLLYNTIRFSADAAMAADPNSFEETRFTEARYQLVNRFSPDYERVGPDIRGNTLLSNSTNGLFVRTQTAPGAPLTTLDVAARFDDTDIVHSLSENLVIAGERGGAFGETTQPSVQLVQTVPTTGGTMVAGTTVSYKVTLVDRFGIQGVPSAATPARTLLAGSTAVQLNNLPRATGDFVSRRLWRTTDGVSFQLVAELDGDTTTFVDVGRSLGATLDNPNATTVIRARPNARLQIDPGIIVKSTGARIEADFGATLIAEGTADAPIVFTSRQDDRYGAGGTFDTNSDLRASNPSAGNWSGLLARHLASLSLDHVLITHAGGVSSVSGGFAGFSAVEVHQSSARITNSLFETNASGISAGSGSRDGRGPNDASVVFVVGSQPIIYGNTFQNNSVAGTAAISINANAMTAESITDFGRQTGPTDRSPTGVGNVGPLVSGNALLNNGLNGLRVRGETLTTESIWDDADIVHVLQSEIRVPDLHTFGGLTLRSKSDEGLVVKLGSGAGITALGRPLDIADRIGGSVRIIGTPGFPVVMTSINDDTVGAGFDPNGRPLLDTNNDANSGAPAIARPGDWRSIRIDPYANDRNVNFDVEFEAYQIQDTGTNDLVSVAQNLGALAGSLNGGDENLRLGFSVDGSIAAPQDLDVYSFSATAGTMVWIDVDRTSGSLDAVVELIDANGQVIALSNNSLRESEGTDARAIDQSRIGLNDVMSLEQEVAATPNSWIDGVAQDLYSVNPLDAGLRLILPGAQGASNTYYMRIRSSNLRPGDNPNRLLNQGALREGLSTGNYRLQVRLQQSDESPGSTVRYADIRFATHGIEAYGMPGSSPLLGQAAEVGDSTGINRVVLGNIANSDRGSVTAAGTLSPNDEEDFFTFTISRDSTQSGDSHISTVFDIDYADGFGRPDTTLWVFNAANELVLIGTDSNIADDRAEPGSGAGLSELTHGSLGSRDPYIGAAELPDGDYTVVVSTQNRLPISIREQFQNSGAAEPNVRVEPINSVSRLIVERFGGAPAAPGTFAPPAQRLFVNIANNFVDYTLADLTTYIINGAGTTSSLRFANAMTGAAEAIVGADFVRVNDAAMSPDGRLVGYEIPVNQTDASSGQFFLIDSTGDGNTLPLGASGIETFTTTDIDFAANPPTFTVEQRNGTGDGIQFNGLTFHTSTPTLMMFGVGSRGNGQTEFVTVAPLGGVSDFTRNIVYKLDPTTGAAINPAGVADRTGDERVNGAGTQRVEFGRFLTDGTVTGLAEMNGVLYGVANNGDFFRVNGFGGNNAFGDRAPLTTIVEPDGTPVEFTGLTRGPRNLEDGRYNNVLFGVTADGTMYAFNPALFNAAAPLPGASMWLPVFPGLNFKIRSTASAPGNAVNSIEFSPLDVNLWHVTNRRAADAGHGRTIPFDNSQQSDVGGGNSLSFGFENPSNALRQPGNWSGVFDVPEYRDTYNLPGGARGAFVSDPLDLRGYSADDLPMLYFNYFLDTEGANSDLNDSAFMRDALRVYAGTDDGNWVLLTTNNSAGVGTNRLEFADEFDNPINRNSDPFGNPQLTQETYDAAQWRQARVSLSSMAGQNNVRLRFEFSTDGTFRTGNPLLGGVELVSVAGSQVADEDSFTVAPVDQPGIASEVFELDLGMVLNLPGGAGLVSGVSQLIIDNNVLTYSLTSNTGSNIQYLLTDSPATIAQRTVTRMQQLFPGIVITVNSERPNVLSIGGLPDANYMVPEVEANNSIATAQNLDGEAWTMRAMSRVPESADTPHLTIAATGNGTFDYYSFTATAGSTAFFDIDSANFDTELFLYDTAGNFLVGNDDSGAVDTGSYSAFDSFLTHTFATSGTFVLAVGSFNSVGQPGGVVGATPPPGSRYQLHLSVEGKPTSPASYGALGLPSDTILGLPGVTPGHLAIAVDPSMTAPEVRDAIRGALADTFNDVNNAALATPAQQLAVWPFHENTIRLYRYNVSSNLSGLGLTTSRSGDQFGVQGGPITEMDQRAQVNQFEGVYIDDIIVGFAERGEMVFDALPVPTLDRLAFADSTENPADLFNLPRAEEGRYQLTVRTAADYGTTNGDDLLLSNPPGARTFDTNDRLSQQVGIRVAANAASQITDGTTFTLSDGIKLLTFEYDVTLGGAEAGVTPGNVAVTITPDATPSEIALAIRNAVNSTESRAVLDISASLRGEMTFSLGVDAALSNSTIVELHGNVSTSLSGGFAFAAATRLQPVLWGQDTGFGEDLGDSERVRAQGQLLLVGNTITNSSQFAILASSGNRDQSAIGGDVGNRPYPGAPIAFPTDNVNRLAPGVVIMNNVIAANLVGGVRVAGDNGADAPIQIARVLNNTIFGNGSTSGDTGLSIAGNASPTVLNNIFANLNNGVAASGATAVLGANLFQNNGNNSNIGLGSFAEVLAGGEPLFTSTTNRRFYLAAGSRAIDSSLEALQERPELAQVKNPLGLPVSPMLAPDLDVTGQRRVDDPTVNTPAGLGGNVFKDRGAVDRSDLIGLTAEILRPQDNDSALADEDRNVTYITIDDVNGDDLIDYFSILMQDFTGSGPDAATVVSSAVTLSENGRLLTEGVDYVFGYNANSRTLRLTPVAGIWRNDSVYQITLANTAGQRLNLPAGSAFSDGQQVSIPHASGALVFEFDNNASVANGAIPVAIDPAMSAYELAIRMAHSINIAGVGVSARPEGDGSLMITGAGTITTTSSATITSVRAIRDLAGNALSANRPNSLTQFTIVMRDATQDYGDSNGINVPTVVEPELQASNGNGARHALLPVDYPLLALGRFADADANGQPSVALNGDDNDSLINFSDLTGVVQGPAGAAVLQLPGPAGLALQSFMITDTLNRPFAPITFEFRATAPFDNTASTVVINISAATTAGDVATAVAVAVNEAVLSGRLTGLTAIVDGTMVSLGGSNRHLVDLDGAPSVARVAVGDVDLVIPAAIAQLDGKVLIIHDGEGRSVTFEINPAVASSNVAVVVDTTATGTPAGVAAALANAINAQVALRNLSLGGAFVNGATLTIAADDEDGVVFNSVLNSASNPAQFTVTATAPGMLDAWIDWNQDGDFDDADERIFEFSTPVRAGANVFTVQTPANAEIGFTAARFRLSTLGDLLVGGTGIGGEVEDYIVEVVEGRPPVGSNDTYNVDEDAVLTVATAGGVLVNDTDPDLTTVEPGVNLFVYDQDPSTLEIDPVMDVSNGTLVINRDGSFTYTPDADFNGTDTFVYLVTDDRLVSNAPTTVTIIVAPINDAPVANDDTGVVNEDERYLVTGAQLVANDLQHPRQNEVPPITNEEMQVLTLVSARIVSEVVTDFGGIAAAAVKFSSQPRQNAYGLRINMTSANLGAGVAPTILLVNDALNITLNSNVASPTTVNDLLAAISGSAVASARVAVSLQPGSVGTTVVGGAASIPQVVVPPTGGSAPIITTDGNLVYQPAPHYNSNIGGPVLIEVTIQDDDTAGANGPLTDTSTLTLTIAAVNDSPEFTMPTTVGTVEDAGLVTIANFLTGVRPGASLATDEGSTNGTAIALENQQITYRVTSLNADPALFTQLPMITPSTAANPGQLTFQLAPDVNRATPWPALLVEVVAVDSGTIGNTFVSINHFNPTHVFPATPNIYDGVTLTIVDSQGNTVVFELEDAINLPGVGSTAGFAHVAISYGATDTAMSLSQKIAAAVSNPPVASINQPAGAGAWAVAAFVDTSSGEIRLTGDASVTTAMPAGVSLLNNLFPTLGAGQSYDGATFTLTDTNGDRVTFEFNDTTTAGTSGIVRGNVAINYNSTFDQAALTAAVLNAINNPPAERVFDTWGIVATQTVGMQRLELTGVVDLTLSTSTATVINPLAEDTRVPVFSQRASNESAPRTFTILPEAVNDAPFFELGPTPVSLEDEGLISVPNFMTNLRSGTTTSADELLEELSISYVYNNPAAFAVLPTIDLATGTLTYQTAANRNQFTGEDFGVTVTVTDDGGTLNAGQNSFTDSFTLDVVNRNDAPVFSMPNVLEGAEVVPVPADPVVVPGFITGIAPGPVSSTGATDEGPARENQTVSFRVTALKPELFDPAFLPTIVNQGNGTATLTYRLANDVNQQMPFPAILVQVVAVDTGTQGNGSVLLNHFDPQFVNLTPNVYDGATVTVVDENGNTVTFELNDPLNLAGVGTTAGFPHVAVNFSATDTLADVNARLAAAIDNPPSASINATVPGSVWSVNAYADAVSHEVRFDGEASVTVNMPAAVTILENLFTTLAAGQTYDGSTFTTTDTDGDQLTFEFNDTTNTAPATAGVTDGHIAIDYTPGMTANQLSLAIHNAVGLASTMMPTWTVTSTLPAGSDRLQLRNVIDIQLSTSTATIVNPLESTMVPQVFTQRAANETAPLNFTIVPVAINDAPEFTITEPVVSGIQEDQGVILVEGFIVDARPGPTTALDELAFQGFTFTLEAFEPAAFSVQPAVTFNPATGAFDLTFTTAADVNSLTEHDLRVRVIMQDDGGVRPNTADVDTTIQVFELVIAEINDAPTFDVPAELTVDEDQPNTVFPAFATYTVGPDTARDETTDEFGPPMQLPIFTLTTNNTGLFTTLPTIDEMGRLSFVTAPHRNGLAVVVVTMRDNGVGQETGNGDENRAVDGTGAVVERTFTINVTPINDPPEFEVNPLVTAAVQEDQGLVVLPNFLINLRNGPLQATDELEEFVAETQLVNPADLARFTQAPSISTNGTLSFQTGPDVNGNFVIRVRLVDEGTASPLPHDNVSDWQTFTISVEAINDRPTFELLQSTVEVVEDVGSAVVPGFAFNLMRGPLTAVDEVTQTFAQFFEIVSNSSPELFDVAPAIASATGNLTFTTRANRNGRSVVVIRLRDSGLDAPRPNNNASELATFTISVAAVNDAPQYTIPQTYNANEDAGLLSVPNFATGIRRGPVGADDESSQTLVRFEVRTEDVNGNLFAIQPALSIDGTLTFQTAQDVNSASSGPLRVWVRLIDSGADSPPPNSNGSREPERMFVINVAPVNDAPVPDGFIANGTEDSPLTIQAADVLEGDAKGPTADEDSQTLRMTQIERASAKGGRIVPVFTTGPGPIFIQSFTYIPPTDLVGTDTFLYVVTDDGVPARSGTGTITIQLSDLNDPPQFTKGDNQTVLEDSALVTVPNWATNILAGSPAAVDEQSTQTVSFTTTVSTPSLFEVQPSISSDGTLTFRPNRDAAGTAVVRVVAVDSFNPPAQSVEQLLTITITPINDAPVFTAGENVMVDEDSLAFSATWATSIAPAAGLLSTPPTAGDEQGQVVDFEVTVDRPGLFSQQPLVTSRTTQVAGGQLQFTPALNAFGTAIVTVTAVDRGPSSGANVNRSAPQTFTITINSVNDAPTGFADTFSTNENAILSVPARGVLANDTDVDLPNDSLSAIPGTIESTFGAAVTINADGSFTYDPTQVLSIQRLTGAQSVVDTFTYVVRDAAGQTGTPVTVSVNVSGIDDAPIANNDQFSIGVGQRRFLDVLENDTDVDSEIDVRTISITQQPIFGSIVVSQTGVVEYISGSGFRGIDKFAYTVRDAAGNLSNEAIVEVVVNNAPVASNDSAFTFKDTPVIIEVLSNDSDVDGTIDVSSLEIVVSPSPSGTAEVLTDGTIRFTPATGFSGQVQLSYVVDDNLGTPSNVANVLVQVQRSKWQNPRGSLDVNNDTFISPIDILLIVNYLNSGANPSLAETNFVAPPFIDTNGDEVVSPLDILLVVNFLNQRAASGGEGEAASVDFAMMVTPMQMIETVGAKVVRDVEDMLNDALVGEGELNAFALMLEGSENDESAFQLISDLGESGLFCSADEHESDETLSDSIDEFFGDIGPQQLG